MSRQKRKLKADPDRKIVCSFFLPSSLRDSLRVLAKQQRVTVSSLVTRIIADSLDTERMVVGVLSNPLLQRQMYKAFGSPDVIRALADALHEDVTDGQMQLFTDMLGRVAKDGGK